MFCNIRSIKIDETLIISFKAFVIAIVWVTIGISVFDYISHNLRIFSRLGLFELLQPFSYFGSLASILTPNTVDLV